MPPEQATWTTGSNRPALFGHQRSLLRTAPFVFLLLWVVPFLAAAAFFFFYTRGLSEKQASAQLAISSDSTISQLGESARLQERWIDGLISSQNFIDRFAVLAYSEPGSKAFTEAGKALADSLRASEYGVLESYLILDPEGRVLLSSDPDWPAAGQTGERISSPDLVSLIGSNRSIYSIQPEAGAGTRLALYTARTFTNPQGSHLATLVVTSISDLPYRLLASAQSQLPGSKAYFFTNLEYGLIAAAEAPGTLQAVQDDPLSSRIKPLLGSQPRQEHLKAIGSARSAYATWLPELQAGFLLTAPPAVFFPSGSDHLAILLLVAGLFILSGILLYAFSRRLFVPLHLLAETAQSFSKGNRSERVKVVREDEIGLLAGTFNQMADEISSVRRSLESVVDRRTSQLQIASEVASLSAAASGSSGALRRMVDLIIERFGFSFASVYMVDDLGRYLVLSEAACAADKDPQRSAGQANSISERIKTRENRVAITETRLVSWAARYNQPRTSAVGSGDPLFQRNDLLPESVVEIAIPIHSAGQVIGILNVHSNQPDAFDRDTTIVLQTLANQVSTILQTTRLLETSLVNFQETALLYRVTRQIAQARSEAEIIQYLGDAFSQLPLVCSILTIEAGLFKVLVMTNPASGQVEKSFQRLSGPLGKIFTRLAENRIVLVEDNTTRPTEYYPLLSLFSQRGSNSVALIPVIENGQPVRILAFGALDTLLTQASLQPYLHLAEVYGAAIERFSAHEILQARVSELQILANFSQMISAETNLDKLFNVLHQKVIEMFGPDLEFAVALYHQGTNLIQFPYFYEQGQLISIPTFPLGEGLTSILIQSRRPLLLADERAIQSLTGKVMGRAAKSWMGVPLIFSGIVVGAVLVQDLDHENRFTQNDVNLILSLAPQIATAVRNAELFAQTQDLIAKHRVLREVTLEASNQSNIDDALISVVRGLYDARLGDLITIQMLNRDGMLQVRASAGYEGPDALEYRVALGQGISGQVAAEKRAVRIDDTRADPRYINLQSGMQSELAVPILFGQELIGVLNIESAGLAAFNENDEEILGAVGNSLGGIIASIRLLEQIRGQVTRERQLFEATQKIRRSVDLETILETSTREIARAAGANRARIQITLGKLSSLPADLNDSAGPSTQFQPEYNNGQEDQE